MSSDIVPISATLLKKVKNAFGNDGMPMPFTQEIFLLKCHIAGTAYTDDIEAIEKELHLDDILILRREPENKHDNLAVIVIDEQGRKLGYIPRNKNEVIARLMDAGKLIFGKIENKEYQFGNWLEIKIRLFMRDL